MDLSKLSDEELEALDQSHEQSAGPDLSHLSDAELEALDSHPSMAESGSRGLMDQASMGFMDELSGAGEAAGRAVGIKGLGGNFSDVGFDVPDLNFKKNYEEGRDRKRAMQKQAKLENPDSYFAGELVGGLSSAAIPGLGAIKTGRGAMAAGAGLGAVAGLGKSEGKDLNELSQDTLIGLGLGGALGGLGHKAGSLFSKSANVASEKAAPSIAKMLPIGEKENAAAIREAAKRLGIKATPGMTNASETVQKLESSLHQAPTVGGWLARRGTAPVGKGMQNATEDLISDAARVSPFESGEKAKKILADEVGKKFKASTDTFNDLAKYTKDIPVSEKSVKAVSRNILNIPEAQVLDLPLAKQVVTALEKNPSADQIKMLRGMVGKAASGAKDGNERSAYWQMYAKLGKLEENTIKRGVIASARTRPEGETIASGMLGQLKGAKKAYAGEMGNLEDFAQASRLGKFGGPSGFVDKIDAIPSERLQEKLLPLADVRQAQSLQKNFPNAFGELKGARLRDLSEGVLRDGEAVPGKLLQNTRDLNPEAQGMLFGDKSSKLNDLRTVSHALPDKVGPSGTSQALDMKEMLNPITQARDLARFAAYKTSSSETLAKVAQYLKAKPQFANLAEKNPKAFQAAVYEFANKVKPSASLPRAAEYDPQSPPDDDRAKQSFLDGN